MRVIKMRDAVSGISDKIGKEPREMIISHDSATEGKGTC
jgi:hypothetical protein